MASGTGHIDGKLFVEKEVNSQPSACPILNTSCHAWKYHSVPVIPKQLLVCQDISLGGAFQLALQSDVLSIWRSPKSGVHDRNFGGTWQVSQNTSVLNNCKSVCTKWPICAGLDVSSTRTRTLSDNVNKETLGVMSLERKLCWTIVATQPCKSINTVVILARFLSIMSLHFG